MAEDRLPDANLVVELAAAAEPLGDPRLFDRLASSRIVLLGESSHGTAEFYRMRAAITRRLIERYGYTIVAVEADWPDAASVDRYVRHRPPVPGADLPFRRFPTWMWRNTEVADFIGWLRRHNAALPSEQRAGFFGLDLYSLRESMSAVLDYLARTSPEAAAEARERYGCLAPWQEHPARYGRAVVSGRYEGCEGAVVEQCSALLRRQLGNGANNHAELFDATQNARLVAAAERYYRVMYYGGAESWNLRDTHMFETLVNVMDARGPQAKAVVWAHNSHIGDARHTEMGASRGELNIGQLCREKFGEDCTLVGFGTAAGTVAAASGWDGDMEVKRIRPPVEGSIERLFHDANVTPSLFDFRKKAHDALWQKLRERRLERFIGVIYRPETELMSHYAMASLTQQFDAFLWFDETEAVTPLGPEHAAGEEDETWPFGL